MAVGVREREKKLQQIIASVTNIMDNALNITVKSVSIASTLVETYTTHD